MDEKLNRIRELINEKEKIDGELHKLLGGDVDQPRRGRPRKDKEHGNGIDSEQTDPPTM